MLFSLGSSSTWAVSSSMPPKSSFYFLSVCSLFLGPNSCITLGSDIRRVVLDALQVRVDLHYMQERLTFLPIVLMCQWFAPTKLLVTFETEGMGAFTQEELDRYTIKDQNGNIIALDLPTKFVLIANHQVCTLSERPSCFPC